MFRPLNFRFIDRIYDSIYLICNNQILQPLDKKKKTNVISVTMNIKRKNNVKMYFFFGIVRV